MADSRKFDDNASAARYLRVSRGLFVLRYVSSRGGIDAPEVMISPAPGPQVEIISADNVPYPVLHMPGDAVVVRAEQDASILATVTPVRQGGSRDAQLVFERVSQSSGLTAPENVSREPWFSPATQEQRVSSPSIIAHVARRGDVTISPGEWVCGPQLPMVIEGLQLSWTDRPRDVDILVGCVINARGRRTIEPAPSGTFVGTRGKAAPIVGLTVSLTGPGAAQYRLSAEALFLGSPVQGQEGRSIEFVGPSGHEPLVGLRLTVEAAARDARFLSQLRAPQMHEFGGSVPSAQLAPKANPIVGPIGSTKDLSDAVPSVSASNPGRVRVFRAQRPTSRT